MSVTEKGEDEDLRSVLVRVIRRKFAGYPNVALLADDIVQDAYAKLWSNGKYSRDKENFGYLSVICIRLAYRCFMAQAAEFRRMHLDAEKNSLLDDTDIVSEIIQIEDSRAVLESLRNLREIERVVMTQRYFGGFTFAKIARTNKLKLNTVLSLHRRALNKLRPQLTRLLGYSQEESDDYYT